MKEVVGDLFDYDVIGHGVNTKGVMGAGIAVVFKKRFPQMYADYVERCNSKNLTAGSSYAWYENRTLGFNIASQDFPGANATFGWLVNGLYAAATEALRLNVDHMWIPRIGCGIGGLSYAQLDKAIHIVEEEYMGNFEFTVVSLG